MMHTVFLTENLEYLDRLSIDRIFSEILFSVFPAYKNPLKYANIRRKIKAWITFDSGGFDFMMGRLLSLIHI